ncbi:MAG: hypothetical protein AB1690_07155, partial [Candidatus Zixiibacteriota bacterium]
MNNLGLIISFLIIGVGLLWFLIRAWQGKEVERRVIFVFIGLAVSVPILFSITFAEKASPIVEAVYDKIDNLPPGSR